MVLGLFALGIANPTIGEFAQKALEWIGQASRNVDAIVRSYNLASEAIERLLPLFHGLLSITGLMQL